MQINAGKSVSNILQASLQYRVCTQRRAAEIFMALSNDRNSAELAKV